VPFSHCAKPGMTKCSPEIPGLVQYSGVDSPTYNNSPSYRWRNLSLQKKNTKWVAPASTSSSRYGIHQRTEAIALRKALTSVSAKSAWFTVTFGTTSKNHLICERNCETRSWTGTHHAHLKVTTISRSSIKKEKFTIIYINLPAPISRIVLEWCLSQ